jgi:TRAP-type C4-dicarboxylate transport system substrate-binding protein
MASKKWWDSLPKDLQAQVRAAAVEAENYFIKIYTADEDKALGWAQEKGVKVFTDVDKQAFKNRIKPVYETFGKKYAFGNELLEQVQAVNRK